MTEFMTLIGEIFVITCIQSVIEVLIDGDERPYMKKIFSFACYAGAFYILLHFVFTYVMREILGFMNMFF